MPHVFGKNVVLEADGTTIRRIDDYGEKGADVKKGRTLPLKEDKAKLPDGYQYTGNVSYEIKATMVVEHREIAEVPTLTFEQKLATIGITGEELLAYIAANTKVS